ncbi:Phosphoglucomutase-3 [Lambiella insularis]|nr:Phosphoglucomutase-3 [Lambiella insularis]
MDLRELVDDWLRWDPDPATKTEIQSLVTEENTGELERRMRPRIAFGTAGLRARMEAGFSRMNVLTVIQTTQGLAEHLLSTVPHAAKMGVVVGRDGRHNSKTFAESAAAVFLVKGFKVWWYEDNVHTPMVPFGVDSLNAAAGIMITASHNPAADNGYKAYSHNGCQINSPEDKMIATSILEHLEPINYIESAERSHSKDYQDELVSVSSTLLPKYCSLVAEQIAASLRSTTFPRFVYTPMHGVGLAFMEEVMKQVIKEVNRAYNSPGKDVREIMKVVHAQSEVDPDFPTVKYPNPEEQGALKLAKDLADNEGIDLVFANDPDADRFAVAEKVQGQWYQFTGDQVGVLLGYYISQSRSVVQDMTMLNSAVSSQMLAEIGRHEGFAVEETLTGFKWLGNRALTLGDKVVFAYEEALGYMLPQIVHDKDGIAAAIVFLEACSTWGSPWSKLQELYKKYGYFETMNTYWRCADQSLVASVFEAMRWDLSTLLSKRELIRFRDLTNGTDSGTKDNKSVLPADPNTRMITCWLSGTDQDEGIRFTMRASGTEPKVKIYLECRGRRQEDAQKGALEILKTINSIWFADDRLILEDKFDLR